MNKSTNGPIDKQREEHLMKQDAHFPAPDPLLASPFDALRAEMLTQQTPRGVEKELMAAFARQFPRKRWYQRLSGTGWGLAGVLGSGVAAALVAALMAGGVLHAPAQESASQIALQSTAVGGDFIALESIERIEQEASPRMVETELARSELTALGLPLTPENAGDLVRADVLVSADGAPLALRLSLN